VPELDISFRGRNRYGRQPHRGKGIGELGATGVSPAIANAVYNATGIRVRDIPITPRR
jgi:xanthine dehydrogenase YagR molybdenum-binding subunit